MLTIVLTILKVIGIAALIILATIIFVILMILFVPIRYKAEGFYDDDYRISAKVSWLLHILTFHFCVKKNEKFHVNVKVLGITVFDNLKPLKKTKKNDKKIKNKQITSEIQAAQLKESSENKNTLENDNIDFAVDTITEDTEEFETHTISKTEDKCNKSKFDKIEKTLQKIYSALLNIQYTIRKICVKIKEIIGNISYYIELLHKEQTQQAFLLCKKRLKKIVRNLKPKMYRVNLHIGMEEPDTLGKILGIWGMLYPIHQGNVRVEAEFDKQIFECNFSINGRITVWTYLWTICVVIFDKNIRYLRKCLKREED